MRKRIVIAKYNEDIEWVNDAKEKGIDFIVYDKSDPSLSSFDDKIIVNENLIKLMNVGRESHTYLRHIVDNYEDLYDVEIFSQGNFRDHVNNIWDHISKVDEDVEYLGFSHCKKYQCFSQETRNILASKYPNNIHINYIGEATSNESLGILEDRGFFEMAFGNEYDKDLFFEISANAIFAVSRDSIRRHPKELYQKYLDLHNPNLVCDNQVKSAPYKMEHIWDMIFTYKKEKKTND